jgi:hypothetical protein
MPLAGEPKPESFFDILPAAQAQTVRSSGSVVYIWRPARTLLVTRVEGVFKVDAELVVETILRRVVAEDGRVVALHDWELMTDYDSEARINLTRASIEVIRAVEACHLLVKSRVVAAAVQAANLVLKILKSHTSRTDFHAAVREMLARKRAAR